jgi:hypothetical protein
VTGESLKTKIREQLQATHVEIEDMSGNYPTTPSMDLDFPHTFHNISSILN